jgi:hypothetical protein
MQTALLGLALGVIACNGPSANGVVVGVAPSPDTFPPVSAVLEAHCGTLDCHGAAARNLRVYGIDGLRWDKAGTTGDQSTTMEEIQATYESVVSIQPEVLARITEEGGKRPERWIVLLKGRETEEHKGGRRLVAGDDADRCLTSWLAGAVEQTRCDAAALVGPPGGETF